jgi:hypothetical protein
MLSLDERAMNLAEQEEAKRRKANGKSREVGELTIEDVERMRGLADEEDAAVASMEAGAPGGGWIKHGKGKPISCMANAVRYFEDETGLPGRLAYCEFTGRTLLRKEDADVELTDEEFTVIKLRAEEAVAINWTDSHLWQALRYLAFKRKRHPVRGYLIAVQWDKTERLSYLPSDVFSIDNTPLNSAILRKWMISAVARIMQPGCIAQHVLILIAKTGLGKSAFFRIIAKQAEWFLEHTAGLDAKESAMKMQGKWIVELMEVVAFQRKEVEEIKGFITTQADNYRSPYDKVAHDHPRQCVLGATTERDAPLAADEAHRRFWPIRFKEKINFEYLEKNLDQLWAEAYHAYRSGESWNIDDPSLTQGMWEAQAELSDKSHPWEELLEKNGIFMMDQLTMSQCFDAIPLRNADRTQKPKNDMGDIMRRHGYAYKPVRDVDGKLVKRYCKQ